MFMYPFLEEIGFVVANCGRQVAFGEFYAARTRRVHSRADAWAQIASACSRVLPLTSALALSNTLVATSLGAVNVSFGGLFPLIGLGVCVKAIQRASESQETASITSQEGQDAQTLRGLFPPYPTVPPDDYEAQAEPRKGLKWPRKGLWAEDMEVTSLREEVISSLRPQKLRATLYCWGRGFLRLFNDAKPAESHRDAWDFSFF